MIHCDDNLFYEEKSLSQKSKFNPSLFHFFDHISEFMKYTFSINEKKQSSRINEITAVSILKVLTHK
jgi:hypothetical protein